jgi:hypothetical protein
MKLIGFTLLLVFVICVLIATALSALFIWIGSKFAGVPDAGFGKAFYAALLSSIAVWALTALATAFFGIGSVAGWLLGIAITLAILKSVYATTWATAFLVWIFTGVAHIIVAAGIIVLLMTGGLALAF